MCIFCDKTYQNHLSGYLIDADEFTATINDTELTVSYSFADTKINRQYQNSICVKINFCPVCGRKL